MKIDDVAQIVGDTPYMTLSQARTMTRFIQENQPEAILELGFAHGVSTCYMAATLSEMGRGTIVSIDLEPARDRKPNIEDLLERIGERDRVEVFYEPTSYTWRLMKFLEEDPSARFDLCYVDGAHSWFVDALAFFLVDRLLKPGGWIIFDDLDWSYATSPSLKNLEWVRNMPPEEQETAQIRKIYELLVKAHPNYENFRVEDGWAFAQKRHGAPSAMIPGQRETEHIVRVERIQVGFGGFLQRVAKKLGLR
ncbi:MAG TPA: class I SAM-dependent methyltransferase [Rhodothermales bacterium]|nr:class I SAM-dependent methyltransferase [Rhodothermales bacterium]